MKDFLQLALDIVERIDQASSVPAAAQALLRGLQPMGAISLNAQDSRIAPAKPGERVSPSIAVITPTGFIGSAAQKFVDSLNPNPEAARRLGRPLLWSEASLPTKALYGAYWEALGEFGGVEGLGVAEVSDGHRQGVSLAFGTRDWSPAERRAMEFACYAFIDKVRALSPRPPEPPKLTLRERDCLAFVAEGKTDWELSKILGISQNTAHQYVESGRKKLGASTRAQAVARFLMLGFF
ncbi:hypothetical protein sos41_09000 [Alphaproteobacteria bacterium SO-S41]|nr:hypothetical protein sos41_09000 [Alphaproteobacteria bacterium SO-S41]